MQCAMPKCPLRTKEIKHPYPCKLFAHHFPDLRDVCLKPPYPTAQGQVVMGSQVLRSGRNGAAGPPSLKNQYRYPVHFLLFHQERVCSRPNQYQYPVHFLLFHQERVCSRLGICIFVSMYPWARVSTVRWYAAIIFLSDGAVLLLYLGSGFNRAMVCSNNIPFGRSSFAALSKKTGIFSLPTCSNIPMDTIRS